MGGEWRNQGRGEMCVADKSMWGDTFAVISLLIHAFSLCTTSALSNSERKTINSKQDHVEMVAVWHDRPSYCLRDQSKI